MDTIAAHGTVIGGCRAGWRAPLVRRGLLAVGAGALLAGCGGAATSARSSGAAPRQVAGGVANEGSLTQRDTSGQVTIEVTWAGPAAGPVFTVVMDTHSVDLDGYDLRQLAVLRTERVASARPSDWQAPKGGHHRKGTLTFPAVVDGRPVLGPDVRRFELVIRDIAGVPERRFTWSL